MNELTIIVPTHYRHEYLKRSISYYSDFDTKVIFIDSSESPYDGVLPSHLKYVHCEGLTFADKILSALNSLDSKYVVFCADDDFLNVAAVEQGIKYLTENTNVAGYVGSFWGYHVDFEGEFFPLKNRFNSSISGNSMSNVISFMSNYQQVLWGLYKKEVIENAYSLIKASKFKNDNFFEILIAIYCSYIGGIFVSQDLWCVREVNTVASWGRRHRSLAEVKGSEDYLSDLETLANNLAPLMTDKQVKKALQTYLNSARYKKLKAIRNKLLRKNNAQKKPTEALKVVAQYL